MIGHGPPSLDAQASVRRLNAVRASPTSEMVRSSDSNRSAANARARSRSSPASSDSSSLIWSSVNPAGQDRHRLRLDLTSVEAPFDRRPVSSGIM